MDSDGLLAAVTREGSRFYEVAREARPGSRVPACPDWAIEDLVAHLGKINHWVANLVEDGEPKEGLAFPEIPAGAAESREGVLAWAQEGFDSMIAGFRDKGPDAPCWNFRPGSARVVGWWYRRQALEAAVHRFDAESAAGLEPGAVEAGLAVEGVDEILCDMLPMISKRGGAKGLQGTLHLHATDADGEWWVDLGAEQPAAIREHKKADTALRGPASGLYLWAWNRQEPEDAGLEVFGDEAIVASWRTVTI